MCYRIPSALTVLLTILLLAGCSGDSGSGGSLFTGPTGPMISGTYQGVYLNTSGKSSPGSGTALLTVASGGASTLAILGAANFSATDTFTGKLAGNRLSAVDATGNTLSGTVSHNASTGGVTISYWLGDGTQGFIDAGAGPATISLPGWGHSSSYAPTNAEYFAFGATGSVIAEYGGAVRPVMINVQGYVDGSDVLYIAYYAGSYEIAVGKLTLTGTATTGTYTGTLIESPSGHSNPISISAAASFPPPGMAVDAVNKKERPINGNSH